MADFKPTGGVTVRLAGKLALQSPTLALQGTDLTQRVQRVVGGRAMVERNQDWSLYDPRGRAGSAYRRGDGSRAVAVLLNLGAPYSDLVRVYRDIEGRTWGSHTQEGSADAARVIGPDGEVIETDWRPFIAQIPPPPTGLQISSPEQLQMMVDAMRTEMARREKLRQDQLAEFAADVAAAFRRTTGGDVETVGTDDGGWVIVGPDGPVGGVTGDGQVLDGQGDTVGTVDTGGGVGGAGSGAGSDGEGCSCGTGSAAGGSAMNAKEAIARMQNQGGSAGYGDKRRYVTFDNTKLSPFSGGILNADQVTIPTGSVQKGDSWASTFSQSQLYRLWNTVICQAWALVSGNGSPDIIQNASDFDLTLLVNGEPIPALKEVSLDNILPNLNGETQRVLVDQPVGAMGIEARIRYNGPGFTMAADGYVRFAVLSAPDGCEYPGAPAGTQLRAINAFSRGCSL